MARLEISKFLSPILLIALSLVIIGWDMDVAAESNLMGVYVDVTGDRVNDFEKRFDLSRSKGKGFNGRRRPLKLRNKHKHTKYHYGAIKSQHKPANSYLPSKGKYPPPKSQYSSSPVKSYVAPVYNSPAYNLPTNSQPGSRPQYLRLQSVHHPILQVSVAQRPLRPATSPHKTSPSIRLNTSPSIRPKTLPPTRPKTSHRPLYNITSLSTTTSTSTTTRNPVYSSPAPTSTTISTTYTTASSITTSSTPAYNSSINVSSTYSPSDFSSPKNGSSQSNKKHVPSKKEIIPIKLKNQVPIKPAIYIPKISSIDNSSSTTPITAFKEKDNEGFFSSPVEGFPNFFKQLLQG